MDAEQGTRRCAASFRAASASAAAIFKPRFFGKADAKAVQIQ
ncbi:hypothetical protein HMPREF9162_0580 [Selenomonas sp. oral taxon 137 str. F0430]|nr:MULTISPECIES: hypothetical protein [Selenomonas]EFR41616.1 hypothetical protein HMPREF9162_0580 [Selenomonas sp. oral taxon 137 str. F0430]